MGYVLLGVYRFRLMGQPAQASRPSPNKATALLRSRSSSRRLRQLHLLDPSEFHHFQEPCGELEEGSCEECGMVGEANLVSALNIYSIEDGLS